MQRWLIKTSILLSLLSTLSLEAQKFNKQAMLQLLKNQDQALFQRAIGVQNSINKLNSQSGDVIYCLVSGSVNKEYLKRVVLEAGILNANFNTKLLFVIQGLFSEEMIQNYNELSKEIGEYKYANVFHNNMELIVSPKLFKKLNVNKVPVLLYGTYNGAVAISNTDMKYVARGDITLGEFFKLISTKEPSFESYTNTISASY